MFNRLSQSVGGVGIIVVFWYVVPNHPTLYLLVALLAAFIIYDEGKQWRRWWQQR